jgi:hypothetical protein
MAKYSFPANQRNRKIGRVVGKVKTFHLKHQNTVMLLLSVVFTYYLIKTGLVNVGVDFLGNFGYVSAFILGFLFSFGFTVTPASATLFFLAKHLNPLGMAIIAAIGAGISNLLIYIYVKNNLLDEVRYILSEELKLEISKFEITLTQNVLKKKWLKFFVPAIAGLLTAAPIPTEFMTAILWGVIRYNTWTVFIYSFIFSFIGILLLGLFGAGL